MPGESKVPLASASRRSDRQLFAAADFGGYAVNQALGASIVVKQRTSFSQAG